MVDQTQEGPQKPQRRRRAGARAGGDWKEAVELAGMIQELPETMRAIVREVVKTLAGMEKPRRRRKTADVQPQA